MQLESLQAGDFIYFIFFFQIITLLIQREKLAHQMFAQKYKAGEQQACS